MTSRIRPCGIVGRTFRFSQKRPERIISAAKIVRKGPRADAVDRGNEYGGGHPWVVIIIFDEFGRFAGVFCFFFTYFDLRVRREEDDRFRLPANRLLESVRAITRITNRMSDNRSNETFSLVHTPNPSAIKSKGTDGANRFFPRARNGPDRLP